MYELRDYQQEASDAAVKFFQAKTKGNGIIILPTGAGKSLVIAEIAYRLDTPVLVFQPSKEILEQNYTKLLSYGILDAGIFSASFNRREIRKITFATIGSVKDYKDYFRKFRYVIIDECHGVNPEGGMYKDFIDTIQCKVVGLTATPYRLHSTLLYGSILKFLTRTRPRIFNKVLYHVQISTLLQRGFLAKMEYYPIRVVDQSKLKLNSTGADFTDKSVKAQYRQINFKQMLVHYIERLLKAGRENILVFTRFVEEAEYLSRVIDGAEVVSGDTPKGERERILKAFKNKRIKVVANVGVLTTGFDYPELATIVLARPTMSLALYYQMCGRAIRPYKDKISWVVDLCGNYDRFGSVDRLELKQEMPGCWAVYSGAKQLTNVYFNQ